MKMDYRISVEELENQAEIMEMARSLIREASQQIEEFETSTPLTLKEEEINIPLLK
jgi:hypothetical protein